MTHRHKDIGTYLHHLCDDYDRLGDSPFLVDFRALDRWLLRAERVMGGCFAQAETDGRVRAALCRCLTCYFYQPAPDRGDPWYAYLMETADHWAAAFSTANGWKGLTTDEARERIEVLERISYMLLDHSRDAVLRTASRLYDIPPGKEAAMTQDW